MRIYGVFMYSRADSIEISELTCMVNSWGISAVQIFLSMGK